MVEKIIYATPYGVEIAAFRVDTPEGPMLRTDLEGTATLYGIHDPLSRQRFVAEAAGRAEGDIGELILKYGGHETEVVTLPPPVTAVFPTYSRRLTKPALRALEMWVDAIHDLPSWPERAGAFLGILAAIMKAGRGKDEPIAVGADIARTLTCILEHLGEQKVDRLEAAAFYALAEHGEWAGAGRLWLSPVRATWLRDWIVARPIYRQAAQLVSLHRHAPSWLWQPMPQCVAPFGRRRHLRNWRGRP